MKQTSKLIVLRGPSGSGKSTVAKKLFDQVSRQTALIQQDYYRFLFKPAGGNRHNSQTIHKMIQANILAALNDGYDVIAEGIFSTRAYKEVFDNIFKQRPEANFSFYFDVSFEETLRRHRTKPNKDEWSEADMKDWYQPQDYLGYDFETIIPESNSSEETLAQIIATTKL